MTNVSVNREHAFRDTSFCNALCAKLKTQKCGPVIRNYCDVRLRVGELELPAHACVLAASSPYFKDFFEHDSPRPFSPLSPQVIEIQIVGVDSENLYAIAVSSILDYLYTGCLDTFCNIISPLLELSRIMQLCDLIDFCLSHQSECPVPNQVAEKEQQRIGGDFHFEASDSPSEYSKSLHTRCLMEAGMYFIKNSAEKETNTTTLDKEYLQLASDSSASSLAAPKSVRNVCTVHRKVHNSHQKQFIKQISVGIQALPVVDGETKSTREVKCQTLHKEFPVKCSFYSSTLGKMRRKVRCRDSFSHVKDEMQLTKEASHLAPLANDPTQLSAENLSKNSLKNATSNCHSVENESEAKFENEAQNESVAKFQEGQNESEVKFENEAQNESEVKFEKETKNESVRKFENEAQNESEAKFENGDALEESRINLCQFPVAQDIRATAVNVRKSLRRPKPNLRLLNHAAQLENELISRKECDCDYKEKVIQCDSSELYVPNVRARTNRKRGHPRKCQAQQSLQDAECQQSKLGSEKLKFENPKSASQDNGDGKYKEDFQDALKRQPEHEQSSGAFTCSQCSLTFKSRNSLSMHLPKHSSARPFACDLCGSSFKWKHSLNYHKKSHVLGKKILCDVCGYSTSHKTVLKAHQTIHTGKTFKCPYEGCVYQAIKKQNLSFHLLTHTGDKPHQCEFCGTSFSLLKNLKRHKILHQSNPRVHQCVVCKFNSIRQDKLKEHMIKQHQIGTAPERRLKISDMVSKTLVAQAVHGDLNPQLLNDLKSESGLSGMMVECFNQKDSDIYLSMETPLEPQNVSEKLSFLNIDAQLLHVNNLQELVKNVTGTDGMQEELGNSTDEMEKADVFKGNDYS